MKKILTIFLCLISVLVPNIVKAKEKEKITVYIFYGSTCPHCHEAFEFFDSIEKDYGKYYKIEKFETWGFFSDRRNKLMRDTAKKMGTETSKLGVPYIIIGDKVFLGYDKNYDQDIKDAIVDQYNSEGYEDLVKPLVDEMNQENILRIVSVISLAVILIVNIKVRQKKRNI